MNASERINLIKEIVASLYREDYADVDLTLRQFGLPTTDLFDGGPDEYIIQMIDRADDKQLESLADHLRSQKSIANRPVSASRLSELIDLISAQKAAMIAVATGGPRIQDLNQEYCDRRTKIMVKLSELGKEDRNPFGDLWVWYGRWSDGTLPSYQSRREFVAALYQPLLDALALTHERMKPGDEPEQTGWDRVDRVLSRVPAMIREASSEEEFQSVGLVCREVMISLGQAVYDPHKHEPIDEKEPSETDAKRMLESFIESELQGRSNGEQRAFVRTAYRLANRLQHLRTADLRAAALCYESTRALANCIAIIAGRRDR